MVIDAIAPIQTLSREWLSHNALPHIFRGAKAERFFRPASRFRPTFSFGSRRIFQSRILCFSRPIFASFDRISRARVRISLRSSGSMLLSKGKFSRESLGENPLSTRNPVSATIGRASERRVSLQFQENPMGRMRK